MPIAPVGDIDIYYEIHGEGESLVLIGGLANDIADNLTVVRMLAQYFRVIAFDRGVGRTDKPDIAYSIGMMAEDTAGLLGTLGIERAQILGISMGGRIALELALQHPQLASALVLVSAAPKLIKTWRYRLAFALKKLPSFRGKYPQPYYAFKRQAAASLQYDCMARLQEIKIPTIIMRGAKDRFVPAGAAEAMQQEIGGYFSFSGLAASWTALQHS